MMGKIAIGLMALGLAAASSPLQAAPPVTLLAAAPTAGQYESDLQELAAWIQLLNTRQTNLSDSMDRVWTAISKHNALAATSTEEELQPSYQQLLDVIGQTKSNLEREKANIVATPILTGNVVLAELPAGHLKRLHDHAVSSADGFLQLADRAETQVTAMMLGEKKLGDEFALLMADSSIQLVAAQLNLTRSNAAIVKKNSANAFKMASMVKVYEAMQHIMVEQRKITANEALAVDLTKFKNLAVQMRADTQLGLAAVKKERAQFAVNRKYMSAQIADSYAAQLESVQSWFDYLSAKAATASAFPDRVETVDPGDPALGPVFDMVIEMEAKFLEFHAKMLERVVS